MDSVQLNKQTDVPAGGKKGISGSTIKIIAVAAMLIDHIAAAVLARMMTDRGFMDAVGSGIYEIVEGWISKNALIYYMYDGMRMAGRLGFPIFCFLLVEGYQRSRDVRKYALRLGIFALVSEVPFDLAFSGEIAYFGYQNVYFTLFLGLFALCVCRHFAKYAKPASGGGQPGGSEGNVPNMPEALWGVFSITGVLFPAVYATICLQHTFRIYDATLIFFLISCIITVVVLQVYKSKRGRQRTRIACVDMTMLIPIMYLADLLCTDYGGMGVLTIVMMYIFRKSKVKSMLAGCIVLTFMNFNEFPAFLAIIPVAMYNGKRGLKMKYFFYAFYPVHLFLLYLVTVMMGVQDLPAF